MKERALDILKVLLFSSLISAVIGAVIAYFSKVTFLAAMFLAWGALWFNSSLLTYEDAMPEGFDNVDGQVPPELKGLGKLRFWLITLTGCVVLFGLGGYFYANQM